MLNYLSLHYIFITKRANIMLFLLCDYLFYSFVGKVCFDFFGCDKPHMGVSCINDDTCIDLLLKIGI